MDAFRREDDPSPVDVPCLAHPVGPGAGRIHQHPRPVLPCHARQNIPGRHRDAAARVFYPLDPGMVQDRCAGLPGGKDVLDHEPLRHQELMVIEEGAPGQPLPVQARFAGQAFAPGRK